MNMSSKSILKIEEKRALFEAAKVADKEYQEALRFAREKLDKRSEAIRNILDVFGSGPWLVDNQEVRIVVRRARKGERETVFFRQINTKEVEEV